MSTRDHRTQRRTWKVLRAVIAPAALAAVLIASMLAGSRHDTPTVSPGSLAAVAWLAQADVPLPADCIPTPNPPPTEYGFVARVEGGTITGANFEVTDMDVSICGVIRVVNAAPGSDCTGIQGRLVIPSDGVVVNDMKAVLTTIPDIEIEIPVEVTAEETVSNIKCADSADGLKTELRLRVLGGAGAFGLQCRLPFSGDAKATITGPLLTPPYQGETTLTGDMSIGEVANNDKYCPGELPGHVEAIAEVPDDGYAINWPTKMSVYHP